MLFQTSAKKVRLQLEADLKIDLSHRKEEIGKLIQAVIDEMDDEDEDEEEGEEEEDEEEEEAPKKNGAVKNGNNKPAGTDTSTLAHKSKKKDHLRSWHLIEAHKIVLKARPCEMAST